MAVESIQDLSNQVQCEKNYEHQDNKDSMESILKPFHGQYFSSEEEAFVFYSKYAERIGFAVRRGRFDIKNGERRRRDFLCNREGTSGLKIVDPSKQHRDRKSVRCDCKAQLRITLRKSSDVFPKQWQVTRFVEEHNHDLLGSQQAQDSSNQVQCEKDFDLVEPPPPEQVCENFENEDSMEENKFKPFLGQRFLSEEEAFVFYNNYAERNGFAVRKGRFVYKKGERRRRYFFCNREGSPGIKIFDPSKQHRDRKSLRCECKAQLRITLRKSDDDFSQEWKVIKFVEEHNHDLLVPEQVRFPEQDIHNLCGKLQQLNEVEEEEEEDRLEGRIQSEIFHSNNNQFPVQPMSLVVQNPSTPMQVDQNGISSAGGDETQNGEIPLAKSIIQLSERLQDDLRWLGLKIKQHEDNLKPLQTQKNKLVESILDQEVIIGRYHSSSAPRTENEDHSYIKSKHKVTENILKSKRSAAQILFQLESHLGTQASNLKLTKDVLGIVATLGKIDDENLSKLLAEYLGLETMLAIVCKTCEGVKALEAYDREGCIDKDAGLHALAGSIGKPLDERFLVICLEILRPYAGGFVADDPQKRLDLVKPRLPNGVCPSGFLGFAVNMVNIDSSNLFNVAGGGYGLRETLFYSLFSRLQVYKTRAGMISALPFINEGAISLDGGIIRSKGVLSLGNWGETDVIFPKPSVTPYVSQSHIQAEKQIKEMKFKKESLEEDIKREKLLLDNAKLNFGIKKQEFLKFIAESSTYATQVAHKGLTTR